MRPALCIDLFQHMVSLTVNSSTSLNEMCFTKYELFYQPILSAMTVAEPELGKIRHFKGGSSSKGTSVLATDYGYSL